MQTPPPPPDPAPAFPRAREILQTSRLHQSAVCSPLAKSPGSNLPAPRPVHLPPAPRVPPQQGRDTSQSPAMPAAIQPPPPTLAVSRNRSPPASSSPAKSRTQKTKLSPTPAALESGNFRVKKPRTTKQHVPATPPAIQAAKPAPARATAQPPLRPT